MGPVDAGTYSPLVLAYIGDAVYEVDDPRKSDQ